MDEFLQANQKLWDTWTGQHEKSPFYDLEGFKAGKDRLHSIELEELGDVSGKSLLHLQCHFGMDTLAWARRGATVTGVDFSPESIVLANALSQELSIPATFCCADLNDLPNVLSGQFDIVFTSYGVLHWLPDLKRWAEVIVHFLKPGGLFYIVEDHPFFRALSPDDSRELKVSNPYFYSATPSPVESQDYASSEPGEVAHFYLWDHGIGEVISTLVAAGLTIEFLHEFPFAARAKYPFMEKGDDGWWRLPEQYISIPFLYSLQARKIN